MEDSVEVTETKKCEWGWNTPLTVHKLQVIKRSKCQNGYYEILEENIGRTGFDVNHSKFFLGPPLRVMKTKPKIIKRNLINLKTIWTATETLNKRQRQPSERGKNNCKQRSVQLSCSAMSDSLWPHGLQHTRLPCPSPTPGAYSNSCLLSRWCHPIISSSVIPFSSHLQTFPASESFQVRQFFASGGQSIGVSASASVLPMNIQDWFPLGWTGWIPLQSNGLSSVFSNTTVQKHQFFSTQLSLQSNSHIHTWLLEKP